MLNTERREELLLQKGIKRDKELLQKSRLSAETRKRGEDLTLKSTQRGRDGCSEGHHPFPAFYGHESKLLGKHTCVGVKSKWMQLLQQHYPFEKQKFLFSLKFTFEFADQSCLFPSFPAVQYKSSQDLHVHAGHIHLLCHFVYIKKTNMKELTGRVSVFPLQMWYLSCGLFCRCNSALNSREKENWTLESPSYLFPSLLLSQSKVTHEESKIHKS
jgi:hypothetical protein